MVRTKADGGSTGIRKAVGSNAPRKSFGGGSSSSRSTSSPSGSASGSQKYVGGNPYCPRPTPDWQKGIASFLSPGKSKDKENTAPSSSPKAGCSTSKEPEVRAGSSRMDDDDSN